MAEREHGYQLEVPIDVEDDSVLPDSEFVCLYGVEPRQEPLWVCRRLFELTSDSLFYILVELAVLRGRQLSEIDPEGQAFILLPSGVPTEPSFPRESGDVLRRSPRLSRR